ncbi:MAG: hypothetical protein GY705_27520 [Bacteroidetes bacterium]|nr:hypothetical protein [Bacteroidota bacterium]
MRYLFLLGSIFSLVLISSCVPEDPLPEPFEDSPQFFVNALLNGTDSLLLEAGVEDYYMHTRFEQDSLGVFTFIGTLENRLDSGTEKLELRIRGGEQNAANSEVDTDLKLGSYAVMTSVLEEEIHESIHFESETISNIEVEVEEYFWDFGDGEFSTEANPSHIYADTEEKTVRLKMLVDGFEPLEKEKTINLLNQESACDLAIDIDFIQDDSCYCFLGINPDPQVNGSYVIEWNTSEDQEVYYFDTLFWPLGNEFWPSFCLTVTDYLGCVSSTCFGINPLGEELGFCAADFDFSSRTDTMLIGDPFQLSTVQIIYTNQSGEVYTSDPQLQPANSFFEITTSEDYDLNERSEKTRKLSMDYNMQLFSNSSQESISFKGNGIMAVAYP